jgi:NAD+ synthase (glutamine-hydrolysing)
MKPVLVKIGMCSLNNDPLDFKSNRDKIIKSIERCRELECVIRVGSELEVPGYCCGDHFNEYDTIIHSWEIIRDIIKSGATEGIVCDLGSLVLHHGNIYNCRIILYGGKVMGIRAKTILSDGDNCY